MKSLSPIDHSIEFYIEKNLIETIFEGSIISTQCDMIILFSFSFARNRQSFIFQIDLDDDVTKNVLEIASPKNNRPHVLSDTSVAFLSNPEK